MAHSPTSLRRSRCPTLRRVLASLLLGALLSTIAAGAVAFLYVRDETWLSRFVTERINEHIAGVASGTFRFRFPLELSVEDFRIARRHGEPAVVSIDRARWKVSARSLFCGRLDVSGPQIDGVQIDAVSTSGNRSNSATDLVEAIALRSPSTAPKAGLTWTDYVPFTVHDLEVTHVHALWRQGHSIREAIDVTASLHASGSLRSGHAMAHGTWDDVAWSLPELRWRQDASASEIVMEKLAVAGTGVVGTASGRFAQEPFEHMSTDLRFALALDAQAPLLTSLGAALPETRVSGQAVVHGQAHFVGSLSAWWAGHADAQLTLDGSHLQVGTLPLSQARLALSSAEGQWIIEDASLMPKRSQAIRFGGTVCWQPSPQGMAVETHNLLLEWTQLSPSSWSPAFRSLSGATEGLVQVQGSHCGLTSCDSVARAQATWSGAQALPQNARPLSLTLQAQARGPRAQVTFAKLRLGRAGHMQASGHVRLDAAHWPFTAHLQAVLPSFDALARALGLPVTAQRVGLALKANGTLDAPRATALVSADDLVLVDAPDVGRLGALRLPVLIDASGLRVRRGKLLGPSGAAHVEAYIPWQADAPVAGGLRLDSLPIPLSAHAVGYVTGSAQWLGTRGRPQVAAMLQLRSAEGLRGHSVDAAALLDASSVALHLSGLAAHIGADGKLFAKGEWRERRMQIEALARRLPLSSPSSQSQALAGSEIPLDADVQIHSSSADAVISRVRLRAKESWLDAAVDGNPWAADSVVTGHLRARVDLSPFATLVPSLRAIRPEGVLDAAIRVAQVDGAPALTGQLAWQQPRLFRDTLQAGDVLLRASTPERQHVRLELKAHDKQALWSIIDIDATQWSAPQIHVDLRALSVGALLPPLASRGAAITLRGHAAARFHKRAPIQSSVHIDALHVSVGEQRLALEHPLQLTVAGNRLALADTVLSGTAGRVHLRGQIDDQVQGVLFGRLHVNLLSLLATPIRHARGEIAFDASAHGTRAQPIFDAQVTVARPLALEADGLASQLQIQQGRVRFHDDTLVVDSLDGLIEGGSFRAQATVHAPHFQPDTFALDVSGVRLPIRAGPLRAETNIALRARGDARAPQMFVQGDIDITEGRVMRRFDLRDLKFRSTAKSSDISLERRMPWLKHIALDLHAKNRGGFDVRVDAGSFSIASALECDVHIGGTAMAPKVNGKIHATDGNVQFPRGRLVLRQASIDFDPARANRLNALGTDINVLAHGEVVSTASRAAQAYDIFLRLDGHPHALSLDLTSHQGLTKMDILSLLTTGHANLSELAQGGDDGAKLDAALSVAGSQVAGPVARMAEKLLERRLNVQIELGSEVQDGAVRFTAAKNLHRRLRLETAYSHGLSAEQSAISTRAQLSFTDRLLLEGRAARDLTGSSSAVGNDHAVQSNLELKLRLLGH